MKQYSLLKEQTAWLMDARLAVREENGRSATDRAEAACGEKYGQLMVYGSKLIATNLLHYEAEHVPSVDVSGRNSRFSKDR